MKIVVLYGGISTERDVSIKSGTMVAKALRERGHQVVPMDSYFGYTEPYSSPEELFDTEVPINEAVIGDAAPDLAAVKASRQQGNDSILGENVIEICRCADIVFLALHGEEGENGKLQAFFDVERIKYTGSGCIGSAMAMNKTVSKNLFEHSGILTPNGITVYAGNAPYADVGFPCVVKPCSGGSSVGTFIVNSREEYEAALPKAFVYENAVIVEQYIKGRELTCGVIGGHATPIIEIIPREGFYDYKNKYLPGMTEEICPAPLSDEITREIQRISEKVHSILMLDAYSRVDFLMDDKNDIYCLEANTLPGMTPTSLIPLMAKTQGKTFGELCDELISESMKKYC